MGVNHPTGGGPKCGYHTHNFHIKPRMNLGAKVCSSQTELRAFVKDYIFFFVRSRNSFFSHGHKFDLRIVSYHHNYLSRLSQSLSNLNSQPTNRSLTNRSQLSTVMVLVAVEWGDGRYCDAGTSTGQVPFTRLRFPDAKERFGKAMEAAQSKADPTSWVIVKNGLTDRAAYYLKQLTPWWVSNGPSYTERAAKNRSRVYALVKEPTKALAHIAEPGKQVAGKSKAKTPFREGGCQLGRHARIPGHTQTPESEIDSEESKLKDFIVKYHGGH
jgi:hypothetical protein